MSSNEPTGVSLIKDPIMIVRSTYNPNATPITIDITHIPTNSIIYISGPMTGLIDDNKSTFNSLAHTLRTMGYTVINPAESDPTRTPNQPFHLFYLECILGDILDIINLGVTHIVTLDDFHLSLGARAELHTAHTLGIPTIHHTSITHHHTNNPSIPTTTTTTTTTTLIAA